MAHADARLNMRITQEALDRIREAAALQCMDVTSFVVEAAASKARRVLIEERALHLTPAEVAQVAAAVRSDADPAPALLAAAELLSSAETRQRA